MMPSIKHKVLTQIGKKFVPEWHVQVVLRDGKYSRLLDEGYHWLISLSESWGPLVYTGVRRLAFSIRDVRSCDSLAFTVNGHLHFRFDPYHCGSEALTALMVRLDDAAIQGIVHDQVENTVRSLMGQYAAVALRSGNMQVILPQKIAAHVQTNLRSQGLFLFGPITITQIAPPTRLDQMNESVVSRQMEADWFNELPEATRRQLFQYEFLNRLGGSLNVLSTEAGLLSHVLQLQQAPAEVDGRASRQSLKAAPTLN